jgi:hypothetical protein
MIPSWRRCLDGDTKDGAITSGISPVEALDAGRRLRIIQAAMAWRLRKSSSIRAVSSGN